MQHCKPCDLLRQQRQKAIRTATPADLKLQRRPSQTRATLTCVSKTNTTYVTLWPTCYFFSSLLVLVLYMHFLDGPLTHNRSRKKPKKVLRFRRCFPQKGISVSKKGYKEPPGFSNKPEFFKTPTNLRDTRRVGLAPTPASIEGHRLSLQRRFDLSVSASSSRFPSSNKINLLIAVHTMAKNRSCSLRLRNCLETPFFRSAPDSAPRDASRPAAAQIPALQRPFPVPQNASRSCKRTFLDPPFI